MSRDVSFTGPALPVDRSNVVQIGLLLLPEFPLYALVPVIEALRIANQNHGTKLFDWRLISVEEKAVQAGNGMSLSVDATTESVSWLPTVLVFSGNHPTQHLSKKLLNWLRKLARHGSVLGAIDTGAFALAEAGLLEGHEVTLHWESVATFRERYPRVAVCEQLFCVDRDRITCSGGHATLDMVLHLIAVHHGQALAQIVANAFVCQGIRQGIEPQRAPVEQMNADLNSPIGRILSDMEENIAKPLSAQQLAKRAGVSTRSLSRILHERIGEPPMRYYRKLRLQSARNSLFYSDMAVQDVAQACGFDSPEVFSRTFKEHFGMSPSEFRRRYASDELQRFRPELDQELRLT